MRTRQQEGIGYVYRMGGSNLGYSIRPAAVEQVIPYLKEMVASDIELVWITKSPNEFRYQLHQGMKAANALVDEYPQYKPFANLLNKFQIKSDGNRVSAKPRGVRAQAALTQAAKSIFQHVNDVDGVLSVFGVSKEEEILFPNYTPTPEELAKLYPVARKYEYHMIPASDSLTLSKKAEDEDIAWTPEE